MSERVSLRTTDVYWLGVVLLAALNFSIPLLTRGSEVAWLGASFLGLVLGEWNWLAVWAVFGPTPCKIRLLEVSGGILALGGGLCCGTLFAFATTSHGAVAPRDLAAVVSLLPLAFIATQSPLWLLRFVCGWRIREKHVTDPAIDAARRFELRHIFAATAVVAICLGAARSVGTPISVLPGIVCGLPLVSLFTALPCISTGMVITDTRKANLYFAVYVLALSGIVPTYSYIVAHGPFWEPFIPICGFTVGMSIVVHASLRLMHAAGARMKNSHRDMTT